MSRSLSVVLLALAMIVLAVSLTSLSSIRSESIAPATAKEQSVSSSQPDRDGPLVPNVPCLVAPPSAGIQSAQDFTTTQWNFETPIPTARHNFGLAARPGDHVLFAFGGMVSKTIALTSTERYDACSGRWDQMAPLPEPRGFVSAVEIDGKYYVVGGVDKVVSNTFSVQDTTYVYDPGANAWTRLADLPQALGGVALATANGKLYAFGGFDARGSGAGDVDTTYEYNPMKNVWLQRTAMLSGTRSLAGAASWNGKIYVAGGRTTAPSEYASWLNTMIVYDPATNKWSPGASMRLPVYGFGMTVAPDGGLYALGGRGQEGPATWRYTPATGSWEDLTTYYADEYRSGAGAAYTRGRLFIVGGIGDDFQHSMTTQNVESLRLFDDFCLSSLAADRDPARPGERIRYTVELHSGIEVLDTASLIDPLPGGVAFAGFIANPIDAAYSPQLNRIHWAGSLDSFTSPITFTFEVTVNRDVRSGQRLTNTALFDSGLSGSLARSAVTRVDFPDLSSSVKLADRSALQATGRVTYTLRIADTSSQSDTITVTDPLPTNVTYIDGSLNASSGEAALQGSTLTWRGYFPTVMTYTNTSDDYQWGDSRGSGSVPGVQYEWIEIGDTGRPFAWYPPADKARCYPVPIPFPYSFYGQIITQTAMQIDGTMYFYYDPNGSYEVMGPNNQPIPSSMTVAEIRGYIALFWDDVYLPPGRMYYKVVGTMPNRRVVIEYHNVSIRAPNNVLGTPGDFELILFEGSSAVLMQYKDVDFGNAETSFGAGATIGLQDTLTHGVQYSYNTPALSNELAVLYLPPQQSYTYTTRSVEINYAVTTSIDALPVVNTATISDSTGSVLQRSAVVWLPKSWVYLPIMLR